MDAIVPEAGGAWKVESNGKLVYAFSDTNVLIGPNDDNHKLY